MKHDPLPFDEFTALYQGVSRMPKPLNDAEFMTAVEANIPESLRELKRDVRVLLSIWVNADGSVKSVRAVLPQAHPGVKLRGVIVDENGRQLREIAPATNDPECMEAAERAALVLRFSPAERNGEPVEFPDLRIGVSLAGSARGIDLRRGS